MSSLSVLPAANQAAPESELLQFVKSAHKASRDLIQTSHCRVKFEITARVGKPPAPVTQTCESENWHSDAAVRLKTREDDQVSESVWKDSISKSVITQGAGATGRVSATRNASPVRYNHRGDAWVRGLLVVNLPGTARSLPFEEIVSKAAKVLKVEKKPMGDHELIVVQLRFPPTEPGQAPWEEEIHFDSSVNYLVRKVVRTKDRSTDTEEVVQFKNCGSGIFFPERVVGRVGEDEKPRSEAVLSDIQVNQPLPPDVFRLRYPQGIYLTDSIKGTSYKVDSDGNPLSEEKPLGTIPPPAPSQLAGPDGGAETSEEPKPWSRWLLPASVGALVVGVLLMVRKRWKAKRSDS